MRSMTGYGSATAQVADCKVTAEVRAVNQRFLDVRLALPREYGRWESAVRQLVGDHIRRGRVEVFVTRSGPATAETRVRLREEVAKVYVAAWRKLKRELGLAGEVELQLLRDADIFDTRVVTNDVGHEFPAVEEAVGKALLAADRERRREGKNLARDMTRRISRLFAIANQVAREAARAQADLRVKTRQRVEELLRGFETDVGRLAEEVAFILDKGDINEEVVRLKSHLEALRSLVGQDEPVGRRIEFLLQEVHREVNTIGSKVSSVAVTQLVVEAKGEIERLREQVQNVE